ncbi:hypothetical protein GSI_03675 [Ganoderma sinense ZZ0214-1]|uniref:Integrase catalytic domain-containing protein n=1 Tax=Ganoderma sinense ZZ0214-1 TaxID=1077348 RepID=A0A2G8SJR3_9APHY|nr:hypothetical protein GSI_03675 [Ganoderma sinense ZZ0214-1]
MSSSDATDAQVIFIPKSTPNITDGRVMPAVANTFEHGCVVHFKDKDVPPDRQVAKATANITNALISDWYIAHHEEFDAMTFEEFMAEFRDQWLPRGWAMKLRAQILQASQSHQEPFDLFCIRVMKLNTQLRGSNLRFDDDGLRATISANLYPDLAVQANEYAITSIVSFKDWQDAVNELDIARRRINAQVLSLLATNSKTATKQKASNPFVGIKDALKLKLPKLMDLKYTYLRAVKGCFKCRKDVNAAHTSANCPNGYPDAATYSTCIPKGWKPGPSDKENKKLAAHSVNALNAAEGSEDTNVITAIETLAVSTGVLGSGSDSETFVLKDANMVIARHQYDCPKKWRDTWKTLLEQHLAAGRLHPSDSPYASPAFLVPKTDPAALPRWVNDYRVLNANTVPDMYPLPRISDILADCAKGTIWGKIDMTNAYFQMRVHPDDIKYTAVTTPFGLYKWTVMPQGCHNAPSTHQRRMYNALHPFLGKFCHVYLDNIVIWSQSLDEHRRNVEAVLQALCEASLFCSDKKTDLFLTELHFLGHIVSSAGIQADPSKVEKILNWPVPRNARAVRAFLGLVRYVANFLPNLADHTVLLTPLTTKEAEASFPEWTSAHQHAFDAIKQLVVSRECLTVIDHDDLERNKIFVSCDASDLRTGALLSFGPSLDQARPVAFDSAQLKGAELNYPVHEKELLAIGEDNVAADALSRIDVAALPVEPSAVTIASTLLNVTTVLAACAVDLATESAPHSNSIRFSLHTDPAWLGAIRAGYAKDKFCLCLRLLVGTLGVRELDGLLYIGDRLVIPRVPHLREGIFHCAHDALGHFGFEKSYANLRDAYYWPRMWKELEMLYIPSCEECQQNKSLTRKPTGPLHPLPVPDARASSIAIDFVGPLPEDEGFNCLATIMDRLGSDYHLVPCRMDTTAEQFAVLFFDHWFCENGLPMEIVLDRDKLFTSRLWDALHKLTGIKLKLSTAFHPQTDGASERTNKTVTQALRYHVSRSQRGWVRALPRVRFAIMNTVNASTGFSPFQLHLGRSPRLIPPIVDQPLPASHPDAEVAELAKSIIDALQLDVMEARDNLLASKLAQAAAANVHRVVLQGPVRSRSSR